MGIKELFNIGARVVGGGISGGIAKTVVGVISQVADKIWVDKTVRDSNMAAIAIATTNTELSVDLAEYEA